MRLAIMQPYFLPYIGYFQLIAAVDKFIIYDNIKYTKKGWINRNRMLQNGKDVIFSLPLKHASDHSSICDRTLAADFNRKKLLNQWKEAYQRAPYFKRAYSLLEQIMLYENTNLFDFLHYSLLKTCEYLGITTTIIISSSLAIDHDLANKHKVLALCESVNAQTYVNAIGGIKLYSKQAFNEKKIDLKFIQSKPFEYPQLGKAFVPWLSIVDVMMFNSLNTIYNHITKNYELI